MAQEMASPGSTVRVHYTGKLEDGTVFDSSRERDEPLEFTLGASEVIEGFEACVEGMHVGQTSSTSLPPEQAYGSYDPELVMTAGREQIQGTEPEVGMVLQMQTPDGQVIPVQVVQVDSSTFTIDANHPLAGQTLNFDIELVEVLV